MISKTKIKERAANKGNPAMKSLVDALKKQNKFWLEAAYYLTKPSRQMVSISVGKLSQLTKEGDIVLVPGKVLSDGEIGHKITIAAHAFSEKAIKKLKGSKVMGIDEMLKTNKEGKGVKLIH